MSDEIRPFTIDVPDDWSQGIPLAYVREVCEHWADGYDWRAREAALNRFDQFVTEVAGLDVHFVHQRSPHPEALPLLITHGWPGSIVEFHKVIEPLVDPTAHGGDAADAFHVVAPSLPGFAFSGKPTEPGWGVEKIADVWADLMTRLGYDRFVAQGGDWGSAVTWAIGAQHPDRCHAIHVTLTMSAGPQAAPETAEEMHALERLQHYLDWDSGYSTQQKSRPQTVGYGLADSPAGQAAWILEKFWSWMDCDGHPEHVVTRDELLDNVMLYWVTNSATSSARIYWESFGRARRQTVAVPCGVSVYPKEIVPPVRQWVEAIASDVRYWAEHERGGHFAAFEVPDTFVADLRAFARPYR